MDAYREKAWQAGLAALQPTRAQLERGLELHAQSCVIDAFCLGFAIPPDGAAIKRAMESNLPMDQARALMSRIALDDEERRADWQASLEASGLTGWFQNTEEDVNGRASLRQIARLARLIAFTDRHADLVRKALAAQDAQAAKSGDWRALYMSLNHVPMVNQWNSKEEELSQIRIMADLGVRMMHLTYNRRNMIGDGCYEKTNAGLSEFGERAVREMNRCGIIADGAHSAPQTCIDAARVSSLPVVASHTACWALNEHPRCKPDAAIRAIADSGGYIGITCVPPFLGGSGDIAALADHVAYVAGKFGAEHVAIGTDITYQSELCRKEAAQVPRFRDYYKGVSYPGFEEGIGCVGPEPEGKVLTMQLTNWPLFTVGLAQRGLTDEAIRQVIGGNVLRVIKAHEPSFQN